jgi:hypothetical protein
VGDGRRWRAWRRLGYLVEEAALLGDEHIAAETGVNQHHGYASYFFTRRAVKLLDS